MIKVPQELYSSVVDYVHPNDEIQPTFEMTPGFKPVTILYQCQTIHNFRYSNFCLIFTHVRLEGQDMLSFIASKPRPNEEDIAFVIRPLLDVLSYLHGQYIVHLDLRVSWSIKVVLKNSNK